VLRALQGRRARASPAKGRSATRCIAQSPLQSRVGYARCSEQGLLALIPTGHPKVAGVHLEHRQGRRGSPGMKKLPINDPGYWGERADEARRIAEQLADAVAKQTMLEIANSYDNLAVLMGTRAASKAST